ncbi:MAG: NAD(P)/FAD-dependent oxidoreductase [Nanoarchaeota archaeon]
MEHYDTIIVGAGPGGLIAAEYLAQQGKDVLVLEKGQIVGKKVCAAGITLKSLAFGLPEKIMERAFQRFTIHTPKQKVVFDAHEPFLYTTTRPALGAFLAKRAKKAGAEIRTEAPVQNISDDTITVHGEPIHFSHLIGADGAASVVRKQLGLKVEGCHQAFQYIIPKRIKEIELFVDAKKFGPGYAWIFPYEKTCSVGAGTDLATPVQKRYPAAAVRARFFQWFDERFPDAEKEFQAFTISYDYKGHAFGNKFLIGDAGGFSSSFTGEGIYQALLTGVEVAKKIVDPTYSCPGIQRLLEIKKKEDFYLHLLEKGPTNLLFETGAFLFKRPFIGKHVLEKLSRY